MAKLFGGDANMRYMESQVRVYEERVDTYKRYARSRGMHADLKSYYKDMAEQSKKSAERWREKIRKHKPINPADMAVQVEKLLERKQITGVRVGEQGKVIVKTNKIEIQYGNMLYKMGCYNITFAPDAERGWNITNIKRTMVRSDRAFQHPHVSHYSHMCLGTFWTPIRESLDSSDFVHAMDLIISFLASYNENDKLVSISHWDKLAVPVKPEKGG